MIFYVIMLPVIYLACVLELLPIPWQGETLHLATICTLAGVVTVRKSRLLFCVMIGALDAMLSNMPLGLGIIWAGIVGLIFAEDESAAENPSQQALLLQLCVVLLLRQMLWFSYEVYLNRLTLSLLLRMWQTGLSLMLPFCLLCLYSGMMLQLKRSLLMTESRSG